MGGSAPSSDAATSGTIAAIASPPGPGARGVIRISGPRAAALIDETCRRGAAAVRPRRRGLAPVRFHDGRGEQPALLLWMPGPRSFTREDVAELHLPGSPPLLQAALARLFELGAEPAGPGEFTRRAFLAGRIDLTRAEGVLALVSARDLEEVRAARALLFGGLAERVDALREDLDALRSLCEASLDFDEADTGHVPLTELESGAEAVLAGLEEAARWERSRVPPSGEPRVVLAGPPNAGKSSLFNRLTALEPAERAIVSDLPGTTRDAKSAPWRLGERTCRLADTAGLDPAAGGPSGAAGGPVGAAGGPERAAQRRADHERGAADLELWVVDATDVGSAGAQQPPGPGSSRLLVWNKTDLPGAPPEPPPPVLAATGAAAWVAISARTGRGLEDLERASARLLGHGPVHGPGEPGPGGFQRELSARHREALTAAAAEVDAGRRGLAAGLPLDLFAESLRAATEGLDRIAGRTTAEDLLDRIFARFCVGK